jgi:hypothetical protein
VPGTWVLPPEPELLWTPGYWGWNDGAYAFHEGHWGPEVGFYGGVSYGFGYAGAGYEGGYWREGNFFYNRTVISSVSITNVYNKTVVVNNTTNAPQDPQHHFPSTGQAFIVGTRWARVRLHHRQYPSNIRTQLPDSRAECGWQTHFVRTCSGPLSVSAVDRVLACAQSARNLVLLGDPQQLEHPQKAAHPEGSDLSALEYLLEGRDTMPDDRGLFLGETWRLHPSICSYTSDLFYEGKLAPHPTLAVHV